MTFVPFEMTVKAAVVVVFQTAYTLEQTRRDNDKKIGSLYAKMKDMVGALLLYVIPSIHGCLLTSHSLKDMENDKVVAPGGRSIEDRLKSLVELTVRDIKACSNLCDAYKKKRLLAKVLLSTLWDVQLLNFANLFISRREEFVFELTMHTSQGVDKANVKLEVIGATTKEINEQFDYPCLNSGYPLTSW